jgi:photosystem II stability/assembly factor-like uncharacterized protein
MSRSRIVPSLGCSFLLFALAGVAAEPALPQEAYSALRWRLVGPLRAGWSTCAAGVPGEPDTFYFGAADGGVWKTTNAGRTWAPLFDREAAASVETLAVAPSAPAVLYVGTGQVTSRWDIVSGNGVYRSRDGGATWDHVGLADSRHIGRILVDPRDPAVVLVAALGHIFGPNDERGVFRSTDSGAHWERVLFLDSDTGAVDLASDPSAPDTVYAAMWQARHYPWQAYFTPSVGPGSGIYKSTDGGESWQRLTGPGLPAGPLGRIGLAAAPGSGGQRVYASIDAEQGAGLYRSDDGGASWRQVSSEASLASSYFARLTVDPKSPDTVYVMGRSLQKSTDGGKTFTIPRGSPGGDDYHFLWINPEDPERMIAASDQGTVVTVNGGKSWSSWYNQPTGQLYHLATDDRFPYWIYSGQQDNGTVAVASRSDYGQLTFRDWHPVGADERDYDIPFPGNPDIVYGSGLGGRLSRWDARTGQVQNVSPWPVSSYGQRPTTVRYRTTWITPIAISLVPPHAIYQAAQVLFRSTDEGRHWEVISKDLTGAVEDAGDCSGNVPISRAQACGYSVISTIAPSPLEKDQIWVGTDAGLIQLTRDGGKTWLNMTPPGLPEWSRVAQIDASPTDPGSAYAAVDRHRMDDLRPYIYLTHDFGRSWRAASAGLPEGASVNVVRQDPIRPDLLYAGTSRGAWVSFDDGEQWQPLQLNLPTTGVNDLTVHGDDLVAATQGRSIWVLDNVTPLRHLGGEMDATGALLFPPATAYRIRANQNRDTPLPLDEPTTPNPPAGAVIDYFLPSAPEGPVTLEIVDSDGEVVRRFRSDETPARPTAERYFSEDWQQPPAPLPARAGHNRFAWDLLYPRPPAPEYEYSIAAVPGVDTPALPQGMFVLPGSYRVRLTLGDQTWSQSLTVAIDPRTNTPLADLTAQLAFHREISETLEKVTPPAEEIRALADRLKALQKELADRSDAREMLEAVRHLATDLERFQKEPAEENLTAIARVLTSLATDIEAVDRPPTEPQREVLGTYRQRIEAALTHWQAFRTGPLRDLDDRLRQAGLPAVVLPPS